MHSPGSDDRLSSSKARQSGNLLPRPAWDASQVAIEPLSADHETVLPSPEAAAEPNDFAIESNAIAIESNDFDSESVDLVAESTDIATESKDFVIEPESRSSDTGNRRNRLRYYD
jgi:hypothetical protein